MNDNNTTVRSGGLGLGGVLLVVFVVLKLVGVISWSWVWVLSPLWIGLALWVVLFVSKKDFSLSDRNLQLDWEQIKLELDKCILVCSNCHREIHTGLHPEYLRIEGDEKNEYAE